MANVVRSGPDHATSESTAELVKKATEQVSNLVRHEMALARAELTAKGKQAGIGIGMFGASGVVALYGVGALLASLVLLLALAMPAWVAALIVAVVLFAVAAVLALVGRNRVQEASPAVPERTSRNVRADIDAVTSAVEEGRR